MPDSRPHRARQAASAAILALLGACGERPAAAVRGAAAGSETAEAMPRDAAPTCAAAAPVEGQGVGPLRVGMRLRDLPRDCAARDTTLLLSEGMRETGHVVRLGGGSAVALTTGSADSTVARVIVAHGALRTAAGVGVGSSVRELRRAYGPLCAALGEGTVAVRSDSLPGVSFGVSAAFGAVAAAPDRLRDASAIPDSARVRVMWVVGEGLPCGPRASRTSR